MSRSLKPLILRQYILVVEPFEILGFLISLFFFGLQKDIFFSQWIAHIIQKFASYIICKKLHCLR